MASSLSSLLLRRRLLAAAAIIALLPGAAGAEEPDGIAAAPAPGAVVWKVQFGSAQSEGIARLATDASNNVIGYGTTAGAVTGASFGGTDVFLAKYTAAGTQAWVRQTGVAQNDRAVAMAVNSSGEIVILGTIDAPARWFLAKYSSAGAPLWKKVFTSAPPADVQVTGSQIVVVDAEGRSLAWYASSTGNLVRTQSIAGAEFGTVRRLAVDAGGNLYVAGHLYYSATVQAHVAKFNSAGGLLWQWQEDYEEFSDVKDIVADAAGNLIYFGTAESTDPETGDWIPVDYAIKFDASGAVTRQERIYSTSTIAGAALNSGGAPFTVGSATFVSSSGSDAVVTSFTNTLGLRWRTSLGTTATDYGNDIAVDRSGYVYVGGWTNGTLTTPRGGGDAFILKVRAY